MIREESFKLYQELVQNGNDILIYDINVICEVYDTLNNYDIKLKEEEFKAVCGRVKRDCLKYDLELTDTTIIDTLEEMGLYNE